MTGYESKRAAARDKLNDDDALTIAYQSGYYDGKKAAQPAQAPVAWCSQCGHKCPLPAQEPIGYAVPTFDFDNSVIKKVHYAGTVPLYTTPPQRTWVGLTAEEILDLFDASNVYGSKWIEFARAVEAKLKERNHG